MAGSSSPEEYVPIEVRITGTLNSFAIVGRATALFSTAAASWDVAPRNI